jgi:hypothetical protein
VGVGQIAYPQFVMLSPDLPGPPGEINSMGADDDVALIIAAERHALPLATELENLGLIASSDSKAY